VVWKPDYVTLVNAKDYLRIADTADDTQIAFWITAASRAVDKRCNRQFGQAAGAVARTYRRPANYNPVSGLWELEVDDLMATPTLVGSGAWASAGYTLLPDNAALEGVPWQRIGTASQPIMVSPGAPYPVSVTALWGWTTVPAQVSAAVLLQVARWYARRESPLGVAGSPDLGSEIRLLARLDPDVSTTLAGLSRRRAVG
jgi:hypothetical protein